MARPLASAVICLLLCVPAASFAQAIRYFGAWSYQDNAPAQEIRAAGLETRSLGYWALEFDGEGGVVRGTYHGSDGTPWLTFRYADKDGRIYADLYPGALGEPDERLSRKSTRLADRMPNWNESTE